MDEIHSNVQDYYGQQLKQSSDLKTDACCTAARVPGFVKEILTKIHPDVIARYYGCGLVFPGKLEKCRVVDLGCGSGRDVFILSSFVGPQGFVVGVDMTQEQLDVARQHIDFHRRQFSFDKSNVDFRLGKIESLVDEVGLELDSFDLVVSNCVVNLSPQKRKVLEEIHRILKVGGEFYFSDVYSDRPVPDDLRRNKVLWGECLSGALCEDELISFAVDIGFTRPLLVRRDPISVKNDELEKLIGEIKFTSCTYRMFKRNPSSTRSVDSSEQSLVYYRNPIIHHQDQFELDENIRFKINGKPHLLAGNQLESLRISRYGEHFLFSPFDEKIEREEEEETSSSCCPPSSACCN